jgi:RNA polymerase sigma-70 factor (ECF subfamily)
MSAVAAAPPHADVTSPEVYASRLYERHSRAIFGLCLKQLRSREDADDAVQTTFIYALLSLRRGVVPQLELPWLYTIARNVCSTRRRSGSRRGVHEAPHDLDSIQDRLAGPDRSDVATTDDFRAALSTIPENQRKALLLREWRGLSYDEISAELGLSQAATEALLFRARQNVAQRLGAGLKTLNGLPLISLIRNLFQTAAAKTLAVGAGAALTLAAIPSAEPQRTDVSVPQTPAVHAHADVSRSPAPSGKPARPVHSIPRQDVGRAVTQPTPHTSGAGPVTTGTPGAAATATSAPAAPPSSPAAPGATAPPSVTEQADALVTAATDTVDEIVSVPPVTLPAVTTPTLPLQTPELPSTTLP